MSKIGEKSIILDGVAVETNSDKVIVRGSKGEVTISLPRGIKVDLKDGQLSVHRNSEQSYVKALHGLVRSLINNAALGVEKPWEKTLKIVGTGYRAKQQGDDIILEVGYSHPVPFTAIPGITLNVKGQDTIVISGVDKQKVGEVAFKIKSIRKPDPYKGKGIRYEGEALRLKPGKKAKVE